MYRIFTECFGYRMYASEVGNGWTDVPGEATVFDHRDNRQHKLTYFTALIGSVVDGAVCQVESL